MKNEIIADNRIAIPTNNVGNFGTKPVLKYSIKTGTVNNIEIANNTSAKLPNNVKGRSCLNNRIIKLKILIPIFIGT